MHNKTFTHFHTFICPHILTSTQTHHTNASTTHSYIHANASTTHFLTTNTDFRFGLIRTRENAEAIAFYDPIATSEKSYIWKLFSIVINNATNIIRTQRNLETFTTTYDYVTYVIPLLVIGPLYFQGKVDLGSITQASEAFYVVRSSFSIVINYFEDISEFSAGLTRLKQFMERIDMGGWVVTVPSASTSTPSTSKGHPPLATTTASVLATSTKPLQDEQWVLHPAGMNT